jgi:hypothetical protein
VEIGGAGENGGVVAVHHEPGNWSEGGVVVYVVHAGQTGDTAEDRVARPGHPQQQFRDRQADRQQDP